jgi:xanthine dehydrogenase large subunit
MKNNSKGNTIDLAHESAVKHVTGEAIYINDMLINDQLLIGHIVQSPHAHALVKKLDVAKALEVPGVIAIMTCKDIPGDNQMGPVVRDEPCLAEGEVNFIGHAVAIIAAESEEIARQAEAVVEIEYEPLESILSIEKAIEKNSLLAPQRKIERGDPDAEMAKCEHVIEGVLHTGAQEHWYLETQTALCVPGEGQEMTVYASTQNPNETQAVVAEVLGVPKKEVVCETRRLGGGFGGKETSGNHVAAWAALLANKTRRPVKIHLFRETDQKITGKRHRFISKYKAGFNNEGKIIAYHLELNCDAGHATDLTMAILERAMLHADNSYYIPNIRILANAWRTNLPSNVAFRGFGGPQGIAVIEDVLDKIARKLNIDAADIRFRNFYHHNENNTTPYGEIVENNRLFTLWDELFASSDYKARRKEIDDFNNAYEFYKKGLALTPVKFGISFTTAFLNQAGALVNIYTDGSLLVNHGGTEMGQGLYTKMLAVAAVEMGLTADKVKVNATNTSKVPNTSATAASSGSDLNGMAIKAAIDKLKKRLLPVAADILNESSGENISDEIIFSENKVYFASKPENYISFQKLVQTAYLKQVSLSATGFYRTPDIHFDRATGQGRPFHYFAFGMAVSEVLVDLLTGYVKLLRSDILHDVGESLNPGLDKGQVEGAFIQGVGWCTCEEIRWDDKGKILNVSPDTYKIPTIRDIPEVFNVNLLQNAPNPNTIRRSKAVGEPPFVLAFSVWLAIKDAISAAADHKLEPQYSLPATHETILLSLEELKKRKSED